jgi:hypothetical protein
MPGLLARPCLPSRGRARVDIRLRFSTIQTQLSNIRITVGGVEFAGTLNSSSLTEGLLSLLPYETIGETWGREVYFPINLTVDDPVLVNEVKVGDIAYWPDGPDICLFFGRTPKSTGDAPVVASPVMVIGTFQFSPEDFDRIERRRNGILVSVGPAQ